MSKFLYLCGGLSGGALLGWKGHQIFLDKQFPRGLYHKRELSYDIPASIRKDVKNNRTFINFTRQYGIDKNMQDIYVPIERSSTTYHMKEEEQDIAFLQYGKLKLYNTSTGKLDTDS